MGRVPTCLPHSTFPQLCALTSPDLMSHDNPQEALSSLKGLFLVADIMHKRILFNMLLGLWLLNVCLESRKEKSPPAGACDKINAFSPTHHVRSAQKATPLFFTF